MNEFEVAKKFIAQGLSKEDIATTLNGTVEIIDYLLDRTPAEILVNYYAKKLKFLQQNLDNLEIEKVQLKKQIQTLQTKGVTMTEPVQQWEYKVINPFSDGGRYVLTEDGDALLKTDVKPSYSERMTDKDWNLLASSGWEVITSYSGGYHGSEGYVLLKRPISVRDYYRKKRSERLDRQKREGPAYARSIFG